MLAHQHGLALITEKLQNQRLEEPAGGSSGVAPSTGSSASSSSFSGKLPAVSQDTFLISDHPGQSATSLSVKGKNVWTLSLEADRVSQHRGHHHHHHHHHQHHHTSTDTASSGGNPSTALHTSSSPRSIIPSMCRHKLRHLCQICDTAPGTPSAPPKKKHCRSLSVPPDGPSTPTFFPSGKDSSASPSTRFSIGIGSHGGGHGAHGHWSHHHPHHHHHHHHHPHHPSSTSYHSSSSNSKIWRPIAVVPLRGSAAAGMNNSSSGGVTTGSSKMCSNTKANKGGGGGVGKDRINANTSLLHHHQYPSVNFSRTISTTDDDNIIIDNNNSSNSSSILTSVSGICEPNNNNNNITINNNSNNNNNNIENISDNNNYIASSSIPSPSSRISSSSSSSGLLLLKHKQLMPPSSSSSASFDSGHFTTSDLQTPPSSPIPQPRPASAASDASYYSSSSVGWFDFSPMQRGGPRLNVLQNRSLSCEDRISACASSSCCSSSSPFSCSSSPSASATTGGTTTTSMPSVYNYNSSNRNVATSSGGVGIRLGDFCNDDDNYDDNNIDDTNNDSRSSSSSSSGMMMRSGGGGVGSGRGSAGGCCSHHHHHHHHHSCGSGGGGVGEVVVPRCHSQPCVLHHRRYGKKRRRDCDRPTLNFNKMTETAYVPPHPHRRSEPWSSPSFDAQMRLWQGQGHYAFNSSGQNQQNQFYLNPIASSPLDTSELVLSRHLHQQPTAVAGGSRTATDQQGSRRPGQFLDSGSSMTINLTPPEVSPSRQSLLDEHKIDDGSDDEDDNGDDEDEENEEEDEHNCSCHDNQQESDSVGVFPMGDLEDLDLEQIETH